MIDPDESLVATSSEVESRVEERLHERTIDEDINVFECWTMLLGAQKVFNREARVAPDVLPRLYSEAVQQAR